MSTNQVNMAEDLLKNVYKINCCFFITVCLIFYFAIDASETLRQPAWKG
jgi:hypothetical protein